MNRFRPFVLILMTSGFLGPTTAESADSVPSPELVSSSPGETVVRVAFEAPRLVSFSEGGQEFQRLEFDGLFPEGEPGDPAIPTARFRIAVPYTGKLSLSHTVHQRGTSGGIRFAPVPVAADNGQGSESRRERRPVESLTESARYAISEANPHARIVDVGIERGVRVATVAVQPGSWNPVTGTASWVSEVTVSLRSSGGAIPSRPSQRGQIATAGEALWGGTLVNPRDAARYRTTAADSITADIPEVWFDDGAGWLKIRIQRNGVYALGHAELEAAGVPVTVMDPRSLRLYSGPLVPDVGWATMGWDSLACSTAKVISKKAHVYDKAGFRDGFVEPGPTGAAVFDQVNILVQGEADGVFDTGDRVVFYALGPDNFRDRFGLPLDTLEDYFVNPYTDETVYWLTWGGSFPDAPRRMNPVDAAPGAGIPIEQSTDRIHTEEDTWVDRSMYQGGRRWEQWFWDSLFSDEGIKRYSVDLPELVPGSTIDTHVRLWGAKIPTRSDSGEPTLHHARVTINGEPQGLTSWGGTQPSASLVAQDIKGAGILAESPSNFQFLIPEIASLDPNRLDQIHLAWIDIQYRRFLSLGGQAGELPIDAGAGGRTLRLSALPPGNVLLLDITDFKRPALLSGYLKNGSTLDFSMGSPDSRMIAITRDSGFLTPASIELDSSPGSRSGTSWLRDTSQPLDYVIVASDDLADAGEVLADWRRDHLYPYTPARSAHTRVVRISDVMDEFSWGMMDPAAIRYFFEYAYEFYGGVSDDALTYGVLLGDTTNDPRDYGGTGVRDQVPSWEDTRDDIARISWGSVQFVSDDPLARFDDPDQDGCPDRLTDLFLGRISPRTAAAARDLIQNKIIRAEQSPDYGPWRTKAILVADDKCAGTLTDPLGTVHQSQMEAVSRLIPSIFRQDKVYLLEYGTDCIFNSKPEAKQALLSSWSEGAWLINYVGHGADVVWADEHVLDLADTPLLANDGRYPVVGSFSCSVGKFSNPVRDGLGEAHFLAPRGGALVSLAASHLTSSFSNSVFNLEFVRQVFAEGSLTPPPIGVAFMRTKRVRSDAESHKYVCLGDPASRLSIPEQLLVMTGPERLDRGALVGVGTRVEGGAGLSGTMELVARDAQILRDADGNGKPLPAQSQYLLPGALLFEGQAAVEADSASVQFTVPISLRGGDDGSIRGYAWGSDWDAVGAITPIPVGGVVGATPDSIGPAIGFLVPSNNVPPGEVVTATLEDPSGINLTQLFEFRSILLKVLDRTGLEQYRQDLTPLFAYEEGSYTRGSLKIVIPDLAPAPYTFTLSATDNFNNRSAATLDLEVGTLSGASEFEEVVGAYPNPFNPENGATQLIFSLTRSSEVTVRVFSVAGRLVKKDQMAANPGQNIYSWDGRDARGDAVANGVYLVQLGTEGEESEDGRRHLERVVVLR